MRGNGTKRNNEVHTSKPALQNLIGRWGSWGSNLAASPYGAIYRLLPHAKPTTKASEAISTVRTMGSARLGLVATTGVAGLHEGSENPFLAIQSSSKNLVI